MNSIHNENSVNMSLCTLPIVTGTWTYDVQVSIYMYISDRKRWKPSYREWFICLTFLTSTASSNNIIFSF